jgi:arsenical pump membrane protein
VGHVGRTASPALAELDVSGAHVRARNWLGQHLGWLLALTGIVAATAAATLAPSHADSAASQVWAPFVLVGGLLLIGLVADEDGLFLAAGQWLARLTQDPSVLFVGAVLLISLVTAVLNLDTSVAFLTPVLVYTARSRGGGEAPLLYGSLLLANAASLTLPGSNLTNLIVLGHLHLNGGQFLAKMWPASVVAILVTAAVVAIFERRALRATAAPPMEVTRPVVGLGLAAVIVAAASVVVLRSPAIPVAATGITVAGLRVWRGAEPPRRVLDVLGLPVLVGLFGISVTLGTVGRSWSGPATLLSHLNTWTTGVVAAGAAAIFNNLPAASLLGARVPQHPFALLVGLNLGPNLFVTGSLAWILWLRAARAAGARPSIATASRLGIVAVPLALLLSLGALALTGAN